MTVPNSDVNTDNDNFNSNNVITENNSENVLSLVNNNNHRRPHVVFNRHQDNDIPLKNSISRTRPGNSTYRDILKNGEKVCIVGDSICRPIDMIKFEAGMNKGTSRKRYFRGATASQIGYYIEAVLKEDIPDKIILSVGTNNLTKKNQTELETAKEIINIVEKCNR